MIEVIKSDKTITIIARNLNNMSDIISKEMNGKRILDYYNYDIDRLIDNIKVDTLQRRIRIKFNQNLNLSVNFSKRGKWL